MNTVENLRDPAMIVIGEQLPHALAAAPPVFELVSPRFAALLKRQDPGRPAP